MQVSDRRGLGGQDGVHRAAGHSQPGGRARVALLDLALLPLPRALLCPGVPLRGARTPAATPSAEFTALLPWLGDPPKAAETVLHDSGRSKFRLVLLRMLPICMHNHACTPPCLAAQHLAGSAAAGVRGRISAWRCMQRVDAGHRR